MQVLIVFLVLSPALGFLIPPAPNFAPPQTSSGLLSSSSSSHLVVKPPWRTSSHLSPSHFSPSAPLSSSRSRSSATSLSSVPSSLSSLSSFSASLLGKVPPALLPPPGLRPFLTMAILVAALTPKYLSRMLTPTGVIHAWLLGSLLLSSSVTNLALGISYFLLGYAVTKLGYKRKLSLGIAEGQSTGRDGRRGPENVWGSAGVPLLLTLPLYLNVPPPHIQLAILGSFATKLSDTFASEIGKAYGKTTFLITTLRRVPPGTEGAVSLEGTLGGLLGAALMLLVGHSLSLVPTFKHGLAVLLASFLATNAESVIGATIQEPWGMTNETVNFVMCAIGAALTISMGKGIAAGKKFFFF